MAFDQFIEPPHKFLGVWDSCVASKDVILLDGSIDDAPATRVRELSDVEATLVVSIPALSVWPSCRRTQPLELKPVIFTGDAGFYPLGKIIRSADRSIGHSAVYRARVLGVRLAESRFERAIQRGYVGSARSDDPQVPGELQSGRFRPGGR